MCLYFSAIKLSDLGLWAVAKQDLIPRVSLKQLFLLLKTLLSVFSFLLRLTVFWFSTLFTAFFLFLRNFNGSYHCNCSSVDPLVLENFFWPAAAWKFLKFFRCINVSDLVFKHCSDIKERNIKQLLFHFVILVNISASFPNMSFFICRSGFR